MIIRTAGSSGSPTRSGHSRSGPEATNRSRAPTMAAQYRLPAAEHAALWARPVTHTLEGGMKIDLFNEIQNPRPWPEGHEQQRFRQAIEQARIADELGYGCWWQ